MLFTAVVIAASAAAFPLTSNFSLPTIKARSTCSPGINCVGTTQWFLCNPQGLAVVQPVAPGMMCVGNQMVAEPVGGAINTAPSASHPSSSSSPTATQAPAASSAAPSLSKPAPTSSSAAPSSSSTPPAPSSSASATAGPSASGSATSYTGDGSTWPSMDKWLSFDQLWSKNLGTMKISCTQFKQPNNSVDEISAIKSSILCVAQSANIDPRFVLAIMMQESKGCTRVPITHYSVDNPGLLQTYAGTQSCNKAIWASGAEVTPGPAQNPCPSSEINGMIQEGVTGTAASADVGLQPLLKSVSKTNAQGYYMTARKYNSGSIPANGDLSNGGSTSSYASDIANRLIGAM